MFVSSSQFLINTVWDDTSYIRSAKRKWSSCLVLIYLNFYSMLPFIVVSVSWIFSAPSLLHLKDGTFHILYPYCKKTKKLILCQVSFSSFKSVQMPHPWDTLPYPQVRLNSIRCSHGTLRTSLLSYYIVLCDVCLPSRL